MHFGRPLADFWDPFDSKWFPLGSRLLPFRSLWLPSGSFLALRWLKLPPGWVLRWHQDGSKMQDSPKMALAGFKVARDGPMWLQDGLNLASRILKNGALA